jgi:hypothetical protein
MSGAAVRGDDFGDALANGRRRNAERPSNTYEWFYMGRGGRGLGIGAKRMLSKSSNLRRAL